jgi:hypothetical protein
MELIEYYTSIERTTWSHHKLDHPLILKPDITIMLTFKHEIKELHRVVLNDNHETVGYLSNWKDGSVRFSTPSYMNQMVLDRVSIEWS